MWSLVPLHPSPSLSLLARHSSSSLSQHLGRTLLHPLDFTATLKGTASPYPQGTHSSHQWPRRGTHPKADGTRGESQTPTREKYRTRCSLPPSLLPCPLHSLAPHSRDITRGVSGANCTPDALRREKTIGNSLSGRPHPHFGILLRQEMRER